MGRRGIRTICHSSHSSISLAPMERSISTQELARESDTVFDAARDTVAPISVTAIEVSIRNAVWFQSAPAHRDGANLWLCLRRYVRTRVQGALRHECNRMARRRPSALACTGPPKPLAPRVDQVIHIITLGSRIARAKAGSSLLVSGDEMVR